MRIDCKPCNGSVRWLERLGYVWQRETVSSTGETILCSSTFRVSFSIGAAGQNARGGRPRRRGGRNRGRGGHNQGPGGHAGARGGMQAAPIEELAGHNIGGVIFRDLNARGQNGQGRGGDARGQHGRGRGAHGRGRHGRGGGGEARGQHGQGRDGEAAGQHGRERGGIRGGHGGKRRGMFRILNF